MNTVMGKGMDEQNALAEKMDYKINIAWFCLLCPFTIERFSGETTSKHKWPLDQ